MYKKNLKKDAIDMLMIYYLSCFIHDVVFSFTMILWVIGPHDGVPKKKKKKKDVGGKKGLNLS